MLMLMLMLRRQECDLIILAQHNLLQYTGNRSLL